MSFIKKKIKKYSGFLRGIKGIYVLNNLLHSKELRQNKELYQKYGLKKSVYSSISAKDFKTETNEIPWLDKTDAAEKLVVHPYFQSLNPNLQLKCKQFVEHGYFVLENFFSESKVFKHQVEIERLRSTGKIAVNYTGKKMTEAYRYSTFINSEFFRNNELLQLLSFLMGKDILPFHTIHFEEGSEQKAHSDSMHMATHPQGFLIAAWIALEDVTLESGPLFYYPGSHRWPYVSSEDYETGNNKWMLGPNNYRNYESYIAELIESKKPEKKYFLAKAGDVLIWHANLLHGGDPIKKEGQTRQSMVAHYFCKGVICYHEISQRPAILPAED